MNRQTRQSILFAARNSFSIIVAFCFLALHAGALENATNLPAWITAPMSLADGLDTALQHNAAILKAKNDVEATQGVVIQTRAIALPKAQITGQFQAIDDKSIDSPAQSSFS